MVPKSASSTAGISACDPRIDFFLLSSILVVLAFAVFPACARESIRAADEKDIGETNHSWGTVSGGLVALPLGKNT
jgi:hypothetical protein